MLTNIFLAHQNEYWWTYLRIDLNKKIKTFLSLNSFILDQCGLSSLGLYSDKLLAHPSEKPTEKFSALLCTNFTRF